jgi:hypothetical protein
MMRLLKRTWTPRMALLLAMASVIAVGRADAQPAQPPELHGALDAVSAPGFALAWGILRSRDEAATEVIVRVDTDPKLFGALEVVGVDPFTKASKPLVALSPINGSRLVRLPRSGFSELPRTEWRVYASPAAKAADTPALMVFYQGVPDTTPEFESESRLLESLDKRIAEARQKAGPK